MEGRQRCSTNSVTHRCIWPTSCLRFFGDECMLFRKCSPVPPECFQTCQTLLAFSNGAQNYIHIYKRIVTLRLARQIVPSHYLPSNNNIKNASNCFCWGRVGMIFLLMLLTDRRSVRHKRFKSEPLMSDPGVSVGTMTWLVNNNDLCIRFSLCANCLAL